MTVGLELARMAAATIWFVGCELPGRLLSVCRMAGIAGWNATMIAGIFRRRVAVRNRGPIWITVADRTIQRRRHVTRGLPACGATVVAALAVRQDSGVIEAGRGPGQCAVAVTALLSCGQMAPRHCRSTYTDMAATTLSSRDQIGVIDSRRIERNCRVAGIAVVVARNMSLVLTLR